MCSFGEGEADGEVRDTCADGGFAHVNREPPHDTILLELQMPILDGVGVLEAALERARAQVHRAEPREDSRQPTGTADESGRRGKPLDRLLVKSSDRVFLLRTEEIDWIKAAGNYVRLHVRGQTHLRRDTISNLEARLDPAKFLRIHRCSMVHIDRIQDFHPLFNGNYLVVLHDRTELRISRPYWQRLQKVFGAGS
jgi:two-component system LytT family response regulator